MRVIIPILMLGLLLAPPKLFAAVDPSPLSSAPNLQILLDNAISQNLIDGGVVVVGSSEGILATAARGEVNSLPGASQITEHTVFDIASLTKVAATTPAVIKLLDEGRINVSDPISRWFPEFAGTEKGDITVLHLMTHTSGLSDVTVSSTNSMESTVRKAAAQVNGRGAGTSFEYADINFILLGEMVRRVSGETLDAFCREKIYDPLGVRDTRFLPPSSLAHEVVPTSGTRGGVVQDSNARRLGGVAGHAGLFSSAYDLSRYARMLLGRGMLDGQRILSEEAVAQMTTPYLCNDGRVKRGLGWDIASAFSAPKGHFFSDASFGHTGYSGSSIWIDPENDLFVIMLTKRVDYRNVKSFNKLRRDVSSFAAVDFRSLGNGDEQAPVLLSRQQPRIRLASTRAVHTPVRKSRAASVRLAKKEHREQRVAKCSTKAERRFAKGRTLERNSRIAKIARIAKSEKAKSTAVRKRRALPKS